VTAVPFGVLAGARKVAFAVALSLVAYVIYATAVTERLGKEYATGGFSDRFSVGTGSFSFEGEHVDVNATAGDLTLTAMDGLPGDVRFRGRPQHLEPGTFRIRYRVEEPGPFEIFCGLEKNGADPRELSFSVVHAGDGLLYRMHGDPVSVGMQGFLDDHVPNGTNGVTLDDRSGTHELALRMFPQGIAALAEVDGQAVMSKTVRWDAGTPYRMVFGLRSPGKRAKVHIESASFEPEDRWDFSAFNEKFDAPVLNAHRFIVLPADPWMADTRVKVLPGGGLSIWAKDRHFGEIFPAVLVRTKRVPLSGFRVRASVNVEKLHNAAFFMGFAGATHTIVLPRAFDIGVIDEPTFKGPFVSGHESGDGRLTYDPQRTLPGKTQGQFELRYDARTSVGEALLDGVSLQTMTLDLKALDEVTFRFGVNMQASDGEGTATIKEITFEPR
jgi:hypothetical protein